MKTEDRIRFIEIADGIYGEARENDPEMTVEKEEYSFLIEYGKALGKEYISTVESFPEETYLNEKPFTVSQIQAFLEYEKFIISLYAIGGAEIPAIDKLVRDLDEVFCHPNTTEL